ncbi:hypothetical protein NIES2119_22090 [[Phormidium ambiguum] IAM M-71]|uniref:Uncharacterized protein n=1 Tax=[Phormidium ambiguum] IAM M-71 TaxID=454136 RepID=A0A1U7IB51_9CYAN|nr:hypothetical protein [Phormidium ambiguum]OKH33802.1 hypothetical protein NIES2119_22090 [Phormidium ambiguum IAM M-71]
METSANEILNETEKTTSKSKLMSEYGIQKTTTWQDWCTVTGLVNKDSYSDLEVAKFNHLYRLLRTAEKFSEKPPILAPSLLVCVASVIGVAIVAGILGFILGVGITIMIKSTDSVSNQPVNGRNPPITRNK